MSNTSNRTATQVSKRKWVIGLAAAAVLAGLPVTNFVGRASAQAVDEVSYEGLQQELSQVEGAIGEETARFNRQVRGMKKDSRAYRDAQATHENRIRQLRQQQTSLRDRMERFQGRNVGGQRYQQKLDNVGNSIAQERERHARRMRELPVMARVRAIRG